MGFHKTGGFIEFVIKGFVRFLWRRRRFVFRNGGGTIGFGESRSSFDETIECWCGAWARSRLRWSGSKSSPLHELMTEEEVPSWREQFR